MQVRHTFQLVGYSVLYRKLTKKEICRSYRGSSWIDRQLHGSHGCQAPKIFIKLFRLRRSSQGVTRHQDCLPAKWNCGRQPQDSFVSSLSWALLSFDHKSGILVPLAKSEHQALRVCPIQAHMSSNQVLNLSQLRADCTFPRMHQHLLLFSHTRLSSQIFRSDSYPPQPCGQRIVAPSRLLQCLSATWHQAKLHHLRLLQPGHSIQIKSVPSRQPAQNWVCPQCNSL